MEESLASCLTCLVLKEDAVLRQHTARMLNQYLFAQAGKPESDIWVQKLHKVLHLCLKELSTKPVLHMDGLQGRLVLEDFDCSLCCRLLYKPVTTPCGHVFCLSCLNRSLDHRSSCPTCRGSLVEYLSSVLGRSQPVTVEVERMIQLFFSDEYKTREQIYTQELQQLAGPPLGSLPVKADIPVIVCGPAFPSVPSCLHIFEPCYRLMLRRCLESNANQFGMCQPSGQSQLARIGTMLTVRGVQYLADGRSMVSTVGGKRFRVLSYGMLDGYGRAVVQFFSDEKVVSKPELTMLRALSVQVRGATENWFRSLSAVIKDRILSCYGELPSFDPSSDLQANDDGPDWVWWVCAVLQGQGQACDLLGLTLLRDRLLFLQQLLDEHASLIRICRPQ
ncbi:LON peptidase N-terminal domain and RING finger protein 2-like isoform X2 [Corticium candelabrum]|nr:LON peptidase N-terminal domain and RING finger protein 2-like isoform X2 [Corticium candelabrum]XP_062503489.1 LON peptidase N-terminal domain and RING finger protein 2-like isoform X2 [Corticium candelabrum]XP_062503490.1 LON peptidase N-terminal domain and RING finger protein 2-like isoform X2 [Corticium candelabrum]